MWSWLTHTYTGGFNVPIRRIHSPNDSMLNTIQTRRKEKISTKFHSIRYDLGIVYAAKQWLLNFNDCSKRRNKHAIEIKLCGRPSDTLAILMHMQFNLTQNLIFFSTIAGRRQRSHIMWTDQVTLEFIIQNFKNYFPTGRKICQFLK